MEVSWKPIPYNTNYEISNLGIVRRHPFVSPGSFTRQLYYPKPHIARNKYVLVRIAKQGTGKNFTIHRLLALSFIPNPNNYKCVNHKDGNRQNNKLENLEWCNHSYNSLHGYSHNGRINALRKKVLKVSTGQIYPSMMSAAEANGIKMQTLSRRILKAKKHRDYEYV